MRLKIGNPQTQLQCHTISHGKLMSFLSLNSHHPVTLASIRGFLLWTYSDFSLTRNVVSCSESPEEERDIIDCN